MANKIEEGGEYTQIREWVPSSKAQKGQAEKGTGSGRERVFGSRKSKQRSQSSCCKLSCSRHVNCSGARKEERFRRPKEKKQTEKVKTCCGTFSSILIDSATSVLAVTRRPVTYLHVLDQAHKV
jgi:hypothetical protein